MLKPISIRISLLTYFLAIITAVALILIGLQYHFSTRLANAAAERTFTQLEDKTSLFIQESDNLLSGIVDLTANDDSLTRFPETGQPHKALSVFIEIIKSNSSIYAVYVGKSNGDFYELIDLNRFPGLHNRFNAPHDSHWATVHITNDPSGNIKNWQFYDENLEQTGSRSEQTTYNPTARPWYRQAITTRDVIRTEPYLFSILNASGITYAKSFSNKQGVLALDVTMSSLNDFLTRQKVSNNSEIFLYDKFGEKFASSNRQQMKLGEIKAFKIDTEKLELTEEEIAYLEKNPVLRVSNETDWPPIDFAIRGVPMGYAIDYINLLATKIGVQLQFVNGYAWNDMIELFRDGELDIFHPAFWTREREAFSLYTLPILEIKNMLILRKGLSIKGIEDLQGKTIALPKGWTTVDFIKTHYPKINIIEVPASLDAYFLVNNSGADATIDHALSMQFVSSKYQLENLEIGPWFRHFDDNEPKKLHMLVQKDNATLLNLLNKAVRSMTPEELARLDKRWENPICEKGQDCSNAVIHRDSVVNKAFMNIGDNQHNTLLRYQENETQIYGYSVTLDTFGESKHRLGLTETADHFLDPFMEKVSVSLYWALSVLLLALPIGFLVTSQILKPVKALMLENDKIATRKFDQVRLIKSNIKELLTLSRSLIDLSRDVQTYEKQQEKLMDSFIHLIATAIDTKSPYTGGHCERVPDIAISLARAASDAKYGSFAEFEFTTDDEWREFRIGSWLHDCGKVTTPEYVVDKATKLETIDNRIHEIRTRFEVLWRDIQIDGHKRILNGEDSDTVNQWLRNEFKQLDDDYTFIAECNIGGEFMSDDKITRLHQIANRTWQRYFSNRLGLSNIEHESLNLDDTENLPVSEHLLADKQEHIIPRENFNIEEYKQRGFKLEVPENLFNRGELYNLGIRRGTLTEEERFKINDHVIQTIRMLENLPLPDHLAKIPEYAGTHHETLIGTGYPRKLTKDELSVPARIMALADVFEALTASDRPYKKAKPLSEALKIMSFMVKDQHLDGELFELFLKNGIYLEYAQTALLPDQIDEVNIKDYLSDGISETNKAH